MPTRKKLLDNDHPYQRYRKSFNGEQEWGSAPKPLSGEEIYEKVSQVITQFGKKPRNNVEVRKKDKKEREREREREREKEREKERTWERCQDQKSYAD